jgi:uncharacterized membrane protein YkvA (DUF1232 family)
MLARLKDWALALKRDVKAIYLARSDPRLPWYCKALAVAVAAYALSPIDLIPDFIPVLGYLDDLIIVPLGIALVVRLMPAEVIEEYRIRATASRRSEHYCSGLDLSSWTWWATRLPLLGVRNGRLWIRWTSKIAMNRLMVFCACANASCEKESFRIKIHHRSSRSG